MKAKVDGTGVVFDIWEDKVERFLDTFDEIKSQNPDEAIDMFKCTSLPEMEEEDDDQGGWRGPGGSSYGGGGSGGYGRGGARYNTQSSGGGFKPYGGESSSYGGGGSRGGYGRGYTGGGYGRGSGGYNNDNYNGGGSDWRSTPSSSEGGFRGGYGRGGGFIASDSYSEKSSSMGGYSTPGGSSAQSTPNPYGGGAPREYNSFQPVASVGGGVPTNKVFANNLSYNVTEDILKDFFQSNKVRAVKVALLRNEKGQSKGTAIIEFSSQQDADYVVKALNGQ